jgi:hypothetical protein
MKAIALLIVSLFVALPSMAGVRFAMDGGKEAPAFVTTTVSNQVLKIEFFEKEILVTKKDADTLGYSLGELQRLIMDSVSNDEIKVTLYVRRNLKIQKLVFENFNI